MKKLFIVKLFFVFVMLLFLTITNTVDASLTKTLKEGMRDPEVIELQKILNAKGFIVSNVGPGSIGNETDYFGYKTKIALKKWQLNKGLKKVDGIFGLESMNILNNDKVVMTEDNIKVEVINKNEISGKLIGDNSDNNTALLDINKKEKCNSKIKFMLGYEETSPDMIDRNITNKEQEIARFTFYSPCDISIGGISAQPYGSYDVAGVGYTFWGANRFSQFSAYKGYGNNKIVLGTTYYEGIGKSLGLGINFNKPLKLTAGIPQIITIGGKLKIQSEVSGTILDRGQFCINEPVNVKDLNGSDIQIEGNFGVDGMIGPNGKVMLYNFIGEHTCGDIFSIAEGPFN